MNFKSERLGSDDINDELELGRLFDRNGTRMRAFEHLVNKSRSAVSHRMHVGAVAHQQAGLGKLSAPRDSRYLTAREAAARWYSLVKQGTDPREEEAKEQRAREAVRLAEAQKQGNNFAAFAERYIAGRTNRRAKADGQEIRRMLIAAWGDKPIHEITARDVRLLIDKRVTWAA